MVDGILILGGVIVGYLLGLASFWFAVRTLGRMQADIDDDMPVLKKNDITTEQAYTGDSDGP